VYLAEGKEVQARGSGEGRREGGKEGRMDGYVPKILKCGDAYYNKA
jgi:hypothetical protein